MNHEKRHQLRYKYITCSIRKGIFCEMCAEQDMIMYKIRYPKGEDLWFCKEHGEQLLGE